MKIVCFDAMQDERTFVRFAFGSKLTGWETERCAEYIRAHEMLLRHLKQAFSNLEDYFNCVRTR